MTKAVEKSIEVNAPRSKVYNQWTQFESFPQFMEGVQEVKQVDDSMLHWRAKMAGKTKEWDARIDEQVPDTKVSWHSIGGAGNAGVVEFADAGAGRTNIRLSLRYEPEGMIEDMGDGMGLVEARVEKDLKRFKEYIESQPSETGGWRGEIHGGQRTS